MFRTRQMALAFLAGWFLLLSPRPAQAQIARIAEVVTILMETGDTVRAERKEQIRNLSRSERIDRVIRSVYRSHGSELHEGMWPSFTAHEMLRVLRESAEWGLPHHQEVALQISRAFASADQVVEDVCHAFVDPTADLDFLSGMLMGTAERVTHAELLLLRSFVELEQAVTPRGKQSTSSRLGKRLIAAIEDPDVYRERLFPTHPDYEALVRALPKYQRLEAAGGWTGFSLEERLTAEGWLRGNISVDDALRAYQEAHLLKSTGRLDLATQEVLEIPVETRVKAINLGIDRWRRSPTRFHDTYIRANIPAYEVEIWRDGIRVATHRSVNGAIDGKTALLDRMIGELELNPSWYVPMGILHRDLMKRAKADPEFFDRNGFNVYRDSNTGALRAIQQPGDHNWLGRVVFRWERKGSDGIFIHDSPFQGRFDLKTRALSHGCVNLEHALALARDIAVLHGGLTEEEFDAHIASGKTRRIFLREPVPAFLEYVTVKADEAGRLAFLPDVYGYDPWSQDDVASDRSRFSEDRRFN